MKKYDKIPIYFNENVLFYLPVKMPLKIRIYRLILLCIYKLERKLK